MTANLLHGIFIDDRSPGGTLDPDDLNLDLTATRKVGPWRLGAVAVGATDLPIGIGSDRPPGPIAVDALVGYRAGPVTLQAYLTRDVVERNECGPETRGWLRAIVPLYRDEDEVEPNRTLVTRRQGE